MRGKKLSKSVSRNLGWKQIPNSLQSHYCKAPDFGSLASTLCFIPISKDKLIKPYRGMKRCPVCVTQRKLPLKGGDETTAKFINLFVPKLPSNK